MSTHLKYGDLKEYTLGILLDKGIINPGDLFCVNKNLFKRAYDSTWNFSNVKTNLTANETKKLYGWKWNKLTHWFSEKDIIVLIDEYELFVINQSVNKSLYLWKDHYLSENFIDFFYLYSTKKSITTLL